MGRKEVRGKEEEVKREGGYVGRRKERKGEENG